AKAYIRLGSQLTLSNRYARAIELVTAALEISQEIGDREQQAEALLSLGQLRLNLGEPAGLDDMERGLDLALESNAPAAINRAFGNVADSYASHRCDLAHCWQLQTEGRRHAKGYGMVSFQEYYEGEHVTELYLRGEWDEAVDVAERLLAEMSRTA